MKAASSACLFSSVGFASAAVRREALNQLRFADFEAALPELLALCEGFDGRDRWYLEAVGLAAAGNEEILFTELAAEYGQSPDEWSPAFAALAWRLHAEGSRAAFAARAMNEALPREGPASVNL